MTQQEQVKEQLKQIEQRLLILDMIEEKLFQMKSLAQRVVDENLTEEEIEIINKQVKDIEEQVRLLNSESTKLS